MQWVLWECVSINSTSYKGSGHGLHYDEASGSVQFPLIPLPIKEAVRLGGNLY